MTLPSFPQVSNASFALPGERDTGHQNGLHRNCFSS